MKLQYSIATPRCGGINHADFSIDGRYAIFTCEFDGAVAKIDMVNRKVVGTLTLSPYWQRPDVVAQLAALEKKRPSSSPPSRCWCRRRPSSAARSAPRAACRRTSASRPTARLFYVADMLADGVHVVDGDVVQADRLHPDRHRRARPLSRAATARSSTSPTAAPTRSTARAARQGQRVGDRLRHQQGRRRPGRSPAAAAPTWATSAPTASTCGCRGRFDDVVYRIDTTIGAVDKIKVGKEPHGLTVWPQPGRYSLGHTGNMR